MRKIILNPQYKSLYTFIETLPQNFNAGGEIVQDRRNTIKKFKVNGLEINVKRYRVPIFINRIAYTFFRKSKACRAYNNAFEVIKRGFETPESIAYIEEFKGGYYIIVIISACNALTDGKSGNTTRDRYRAMKL